MPTLDEIRQQKRGRFSDILETEPTQDKPLGGGLEEFKKSAEMRSQSLEKALLASTLAENKGVPQKSLADKILGGIGKATGLGAIGNFAGNVIKEGVDLGGDILRGDMEDLGNSTIENPSKEFSKAVAGLGQFGVVTAGGGVGGTILKSGAGILGKMATGSVIGAVTLGAEEGLQALSEGSTLEEAEQEALSGLKTGAIFGAATPVVFKAGGKILKGTLGQVIDSLAKDDAALGQIAKNIQKTGLTAEDARILKSKIGDDLVISKNLTKAEQGAREAKKAATEILQPGSKSTAIRRKEFSNPAEVLAKEIAETDVPITNYQQLSEFADNKSSQLHNQVLEIVKTKTDDLGDSYLSKIQKTIDDLADDPQFEDIAEKYKEYLTREQEWVAKQGAITPELLQKRKQDLGKKVGKLYNQGIAKDISEDTQIKLQALDDIRGGAQETIAEIFPEVADLNKRSSGLMDASALARVQRERANNAISDPKFRDLLATDKLAALNWLKERIPVAKNFGVDNLTKLDTKSDLLEKILPTKINAIRRNSANLGMPK